MSGKAGNDAFNGNILTAMLTGLSGLSGSGADGVVALPRL